MNMSMRCYLGIDAGTQGLSLVLTDEQLNVAATAEAAYDMLADRGEGCYEQNPLDWRSALGQAMDKLRQQQGDDLQVLAIGVSGQMHGEVLTDSGGVPVGSARLWCDSRNADEEQELTARLGVKVPKRMTAARWLWTTRHQPGKATAARHLTTPAGWLSQQLTGHWNLGIGDAAGMFPIDQGTLDFDQSLLERFHDIAGPDFPPLSELLPHVRRAGEDAGTLHDEGAALLGLPTGIPVAAAEGDQPAALAGSLIGEAGMVAVSFGTSVCANSVGDRPFAGVHPAIDHFCAADGKPINMVWLRNGTTFMNTVVDMFGDAMGGDREAGFAAVVPRVLEAPADCGGLLALPFMDDEPGLGIERGGAALLAGWNPENATCGNAVKAALLATMFNLRLGCEVLDAQGYPRRELVLSGGLARTPEFGQILADVFETPVRLLASAEEGTAWGAALLAKFLHQRLTSPQTQEWSAWLACLRGSESSPALPDPGKAAIYQEVFQRYRKLMRLHGQLDQVLAAGPRETIQK
jgi:sugar (pentulose or hexulose) kinase